jgi:periplasmic divalent cation tolerance protein
MNDTQVVLAVCTVPEKEARSLVDQLLAEHLVACINMLGPVVSRYHWEGKIEEGREIVLLMKTTAARKEQLRGRIAELHSYTVPEVLEFDVDSGLESYLDWVRRSCSDA